MSVFAYWSFFGTFYLLLLTWQDYKNKRMVDDRRNWFMMGLSISLMSHNHIQFLYMLALIIVLAVLYWFMHKVKAVGDADVNTISWLFLGYGLISPFKLLFFVAVFAVLTIMFMLLKKLLRIDNPAQYYGVILLSFVITNLLQKLY